MSAPHPLFGSRLPREGAPSVVDDERQFASVLHCLVRVGRDKAIGYLPMQTIRDLLGVPISEARRYYAQRAEVLLVEAPESCIQSGAFFVFDDVAIRLSEYWPLLAALGSATPNDFVRHLGRRWLAPDDPLMPTVRAFFADEPLTPAVRSPPLPSSPPARR